MKAPTAEAIPITGQTVLVFPNYQIQFDPEDYIIFRFGCTFGDSSYRFTHENVVARQIRVFEFKHAGAHGRKFYTTKEGVQHYLVLDKKNIQVVKVCDSSYPWVRIGNHSVQLNVTGIVSTQATDFIRRVADTCINHPVTVLRKVAERALSVQACQQKGIILQLEEPTDGEKALALEALARTELPAKIQPGMPLVLAGGSFRGHTEVTFTAKAGTNFTSVVDGHLYRVRPAQINWAKTAKRIQVPIKLPDSFNHLKEGKRT